MSDMLPYQFTWLSFAPTSVNEIDILRVAANHSLITRAHRMHVCAGNTRTHSGMAHIER